MTDNGGIAILTRFKANDQAPEDDKHTFSDTPMVFLKPTQQRNYLVCLRSAKI